VLDPHSSVPFLHWAFLLQLDPTDIPERMRDLPECGVMRAKAMLVRQYYPDFRRFLKNLRGRRIDGMVASIPYCRAFVVQLCHFRRLGVGEAAVADRRSYHQDALKAVEFFKYLCLGRCAENLAEAFGDGSHALTRCYGAVYLILFPA
jgi:hypothetical protein